MLASMLTNAWSQGISIAAFIALTAIAPARGADLATKRALTLEIAKGMISAAEQKASGNHWAMVITVLDDAGNLLAFERMDGAQVGSIDISQRKASSSLRFRAPTKNFADGIARGSAALVTLGVVTFEGGLPIVVDGQVIGAIGVSGGAADQDGQAAKAGLEWFDANVKK